MFSSGYLDIYLDTVIHTLVPGHTAALVTAG